MEANPNLLRSQNFGLQGEEIAARYLESRGWKILHRRFRVRGGEIDLVAEFEGTIIFVEVKSRAASSLDDGRGAVDRNKRRCLARAAGIYLARHGHGERPCRFDIVTVVSRQEGYSVKHHQGAFDLA